MVPIHESDVAEHRWKVGEWSTVELWEKVELQLRRRRRWTIFAVILVFLSLIAIPIVKDRGPKWRSLRLSRSLAQEFNELKLEAVRSQRTVAFGVELGAPGLQLFYRFVPSCENPGTAEFRREPLFSEKEVAGLTLLDSQTASGLGLERITREFCFSPLGDLSSDANELAVGILPAKDLAEKRTDRISFVFFRPLTTEFSFD